MIFALPNPSPQTVAHTIVVQANAARTNPADAVIVSASCRRPANRKRRDYFCVVFAVDPAAPKVRLCRYAEVVGPPYRVLRISDCTGKPTPLGPPA